MPCQSATAMVRAAFVGGYAVPALDIETCDMAEAVLAAAEKARTPLIVQITPRTLDRLGWRWLSRHLRDLCDAAPFPVSLHLDHATSVEAALRGLDHGFTSVMYDGSHLPPDENARNTAAVAEAARRAGASVEGEIGHVGRDGEPPGLDHLTTAEEARAFAAATGVDFLAVAVGTRHGHSPGPGGIDLGRLEEIRAAVSIPLVLHGGSGVPDGQLRAAIARGIAKVNVGTALNRAYMGAVDAAAPAPRDVVERAMAAVGAEAERVFALTGSAGAA
jgi:ketose-bisphosphate aldolase